MLFGVELRGRDMKVDPNSKILLSYIAIDANGKVRGGNTDSVTLTSLKPESKARIEQSGLRMLNRLDLPPGKYQLRDRGATIRPAGTSARCSTTSRCPTYAKAPFSMSGLVLTSGSGAAFPTVKADEQLKPMMPGPPIALRDVSAERRDRAVHRGVTTTPARRRTRSTSSRTVTTDDGKVLFKTDEMRDSTDLGGKRGGYGYTDARADEGPGARQLRAEGRGEVALEATRRRSRASCSSPWRRRGWRRRDDRRSSSRSR